MDPHKPQSPLEQRDTHREKETITPALLRWTTLSLFTGHNQSEQKELLFCVSWSVKFPGKENAQIGIAPAVSVRWLSGDAQRRVRESKAVRDSARGSAAARLWWQGSLLPACQACQRARFPWVWLQLRFSAMHSVNFTVRDSLATVCPFLDEIALRNKRKGNPFDAN